MESVALWGCELLCPSLNQRWSTMTLGSLGVSLTAPPPPRTPRVHGDSVLMDVVIIVFTGTAERCMSISTYRTQGQRQGVKQLKTATGEHQARSWSLSCGGLWVNVCAEPREATPARGTCAHHLPGPGPSDSQRLSWVSCTPVLCLLGSGKVHPRGTWVMHA